MSFQTYSSRYNFFVKWRNVQLCMQINFITKFFIYCPWFSRNNSISGATSLKALRKESLIQRGLKIYFVNLLYVTIFGQYSLFRLAFHNALDTPIHLVVDKIFRSLSISMGIKYFTILSEYFSHQMHHRSWFFNNNRLETFPYYKGSIK